MMNIKDQAARLTSYLGTSPPPVNILTAEYYIRDLFRSNIVSMSFWHHLLSTIYQPGTGCVVFPPKSHSIKIFRTQFPMMTPKARTLPSLEWLYRAIDDYVLCIWGTIQPCLLFWKQPTPHVVMWLRLSNPGHS